MLDDDLLSIRYLNDLLFCERRAALHLIEGIWCDNKYTTEGLLAHKRVNLPRNVFRKEQQHVTGMWLVSHQLGLIGKGDLIEFLQNASGQPTPYPVEFKRGKRRRWDNNEAQLCAQALCLEEMLDVTVPCGAIFHINSQRREEITFGESLRKKTAEAAARLHELVRKRETPEAKYHRKCEGCSLLHWCMPKSLGSKEKAARYVQSLLDDSFRDSTQGDCL